MNTYRACFRLIPIGAWAALTAVGLAQAPQTPVMVASNTTAPSVPVEEIIQKFAAKEAEFARARDNYTYHQTVRIQELDDDGVARGRYEIVSDIIFTPEGKRIERVVRAPVSTLRNVGLTQEDA